MRCEPILQKSAEIKVSIHSHDDSLDHHLTSVLPKTRRSIFSLAINQPLLIFFAGLLIATLIPHLIVTRLMGLSNELSPQNTSLLAMLIGYMSGFLMVRRMANMPGTRTITSVLPALVLSYGLTSAIFFGLDLSFSRYQFGYSFIISTVFLLGVTIVQRRVSKPEFGIVGKGRALDLKDIEACDWHIFEVPGDAKQFDDMALAVDFRAIKDSAEWERFLADEAVRGRKIFSSKVLRESLVGRTQIDHLSENPSGQLAPDALYSSLKLYADFFVAFLALILLSPILLMTAILIRLETPGPSLFIQLRTGYRGKAFKVYKFRSMTVIDETKRTIDTDMTQSDDARITRIGRVIRKTRIDELPQLLNILKGEMSLIGPRPETLRLSKWYEDEIPFYHYRHIVRPGITGWAQVNQGHVVGVEDVREKLEYDLYYVRNFSIWLDFLIVLKTLRVILTGHGAK